MILFNSKKEIIEYIPIERIFSFPDHPFEVKDDEYMRETLESVKEYGVLSPVIVRPREEGGYEMISGHRRMRACELAGINSIRIMADTFCSSKPFFVINGNKVPRNDVIDRLLIIDENHISYVFDVVDETRPEIHNPKNYYLSALYNAPMTMDSYITAKLKRLGVI